MREYTGFDGWGQRRPGTEAFARGLVRATGGRLVFLGSYVQRWMRNSSGVLVGSPSVHGTGRAFDVGRRAGYQGHQGSDRATFETYIDRIIAIADDIGLELLLDYEGERSWKCDREAWRDWGGGGPGMDWIHVELDTAHADGTWWVADALTAVAGTAAAPVWPGGAHYRLTRTRPSGARKATVERIQTALAGHGYDTGPLDGWYGPITEAAVKAFQTDHPPLKVDGICGPNTWAALF